MKGVLKMVIWGCMMMISPILLAQNQPTKLKLPWDEIQRLLKLDSKEITLKADEFHALLTRTTLKKIPTYSQSAGEITISHEEFKKLLDSLLPPPAPALQTYLTKGVYRATIKKNAILVQADLDLHLRNSQNKLMSVAIFPGQVAFEDVRLDDATTLLEQKDGRLYLSTNLDGHHVVKIKFAVPKPPENKGHTAEFPIARTPITEVLVTLPTEEVEFVFDGALNVNTERSKAGTRATAYLSPTERASFHWFPILPSRSEGPAKVYAETNSLLFIEEDTLRVTSRVNLQVLQNTINSVDLLIPIGFSVIDVQGDQVEDWSVSNKRSGVLHIPFTVARKGSLSLTVTLEQILTSKKMSVQYGGMFVMGALRDKGFVGVELRTAAEVSLNGDTKGLERIDTQELPGELINQSRRPLLFGFRYLHPTFELPLTVNQHDRVALLNSLIDHAQGRTWLTTDGKLVHQFTFSMHNSGKQFLELTLPPQAQLWSAFVGGSPVKPSLKDNKTILLPLNRSSEGRSFHVDVVYLEEGSKPSVFGHRQLAGPALDMMMGELNWDFYLPSNMVYFLYGRDFEKAKDKVMGLPQSISMLDGRTGGAMGGRQSRQTMELSDKLAPAGIIKKDNRTEPALKELEIEGDEFAEEQKLMQSAKIPQEKRDDKDEGFMKARPNKVRESGVLPVRVNIPVTGQGFHFHRSLVMKGAPLTMNVFSMDAKIKTVLLLILMGATILLGWLQKPRISRFFRPLFILKDPVLSRLKSLHTPTGHILIVFVLNILISQWPMPIPFIGIAGLIFVLARWVFKTTRQTGGSLS